MVSHIKHPQHFTVDGKEWSLNVFGNVTIESFLFSRFATKDERAEIPDVLRLHANKSHSHTHDVYLTYQDKIYKPFRLEKKMVW